MSFATPAFAALLCTIALMVALRPVAARINLIDSPGGRKRHTGNIPIIGGISMFIGIGLVLSVAVGMGDGIGYLILAGALLVLVGTLDDHHGLHYIVRLSAQLGATLIMIMGGGLILADIGDPFGFGIIYLGPLAVLGTALVTMSSINAVNFIDGLDGLASSMILVALIAGLIATGGAAPTMPVTLVVCAGIIGFLIFNFPGNADRPFRTFMGDAGSTFLGLTVVWLTLGLTQGEDRYFSPVIGLWFGIVPLADFFFCFAKRIAHGRSPFTPGREHFHYMLRDAGMTTRQVLGTLTGLASLYAAIGLVGHRIGAPDCAMFTIWAVVGASQYWLIKHIASQAADRHLSPAVTVSRIGIAGAEKMSRIQRPPLSGYRTPPTQPRS